MNHQIGLLILMCVIGLTSRAQARGTDDIRQPATSRQTEGAIPRYL